ncbi:MAG TPA: copper chaperone PCu(A)C [Woeseiaceae bacterium]|nr:copper chaperone PCu(A)C [Woeseiaceae bacterium]
MTRPALVLLAFALALQGCGEGDSPALVASHARLFAPLPGRTASVAYLDLENRSSRSITLHGASSPAFARAELHETTISNGVASMRPLASIVVEAGSQMRFEPGGKHIMLIDPLKAVLPGASVLLQLHYDDAGLLAIEAEVQTRLDDNDN